MTGTLPKEIAQKLIEQADGLAILAEANDAVAQYFRPRFEACWRDGRLHDSVLANRLRPHVLDREAEAKQWRLEETELRDAAVMILRSLECPHAG